MDQLFASRSKGLRGCCDGRATNRCVSGGLPVSTYLLFAFLFALSLSARVLAKERVVKVFLIPHSHCDPGWLETFEGYHTQRVERILTEVMNSLERSPDRRFVWAEISFFSRWFDSKTAAVKQQVRKFVENGQLEFVEGGWVQPDEANTNFDILVNQLTEGHDYLLKNFGVRPRFAWQIDPFGHSSLTPTLAAAVGFDALVINRIHHNLKSYFKQTRHMEFVWQGSPSLGEQSEIFTHVLHTHYSAPLGFDFEEGSPSIVDNNVGHRAQQLVGELKSRSEAYRTDNLLVTFGDDFKFQRAEHQFSNMDKLIQEINAGQYGMKIQYATLSEYFDTVFASKANFPLYKGDFFPYADNSDSYWTGYYTTRPRLKGLIRQATSILHSADTAYALGRARDFSMHIPTSWDAHYREILQSRRDTCLVQHHDGITGTAKPFVAEDYTNRLNSAIVHSHWTMAEMTKHLLCDTKQDAAGFDVLKQVEFAVYDPQGHVFTVDASRDHPLVYHNALGWTRYQYVQVKVSAVDPLNLRIYDANDKPVPVQMSPFNSNSGVAAPADKSVFFLNFLAEVPPLGIATYFVRAVDTQSVPEAPRQFKALYYKHGDLASQSSTLKIENDFLTLMLSHTTGLPEKLINKVTGQEIALDQKYAEYHTSRSGAYLFRPSALTELTEQVEMSIVVGDLMSEVVIGFGPRRRLSLRLYSTPQDTHAYPEVCGVLFTTHQIDAGGNREVVVRYNTHLPTDNTFYTDNGIELQLRSRQSNHARSRAHIEPARADAQETQYYPSISIAMLRHNAQDLQFTVISSQSMGTTSHTEGGLEIMLNRHLSQDDGRGLGEGVPEHDPVTVQQWLMLGHAEDAELHRRRLSLQQNHPLMTITLKQVPTPFVWAEHFVNSYAPLSGSLPDNVHLLSLKARDAVSSEVVVRLMHIAEGTEAIAAPTEVLPQQFQSEVTIKLSDLLDSTTDSWVVEHPRARSLSLNYDADEVEQRVRYDSSLGSLSMKIDHSALSRGGRQNTDEEGVFLSQAALDKMESEAKEKKSKHVGRKPLSVDDSNDAGSYKHNLLNDTETYGQEVQQRGVKRRLFDPASLSIDARQRKLLAVGKDADPLTVLLRPLQMKSLLLRLASANAQPATTSTTSQVAARPVSGQREESTKEVDKLAEGRKKFREAAALRQRQKEERLRVKEEEERQRKEQGARGDIEKVIDLEDKAKTPDTRRAEPSAPGIAPSDVLYRDQQFISAGLEGERVMMMFISIVVVSLMILFYLALHRRHASAIISVSALAAAYPWTSGSAPQYSAATGVASSPAASGKDFYRREMDQRLYSKMV